MRLRRLRSEERGFTMAPVAIADRVSSASWSSSPPGRSTAICNLTRNDLDHKQAYEAGAGRARRLRLPPQQGHQLLDPLHLGAEPERGQPDRLDREAAPGARAPAAPPTRSSWSRAPASRSCSTSNPVGTMIEQSGAEHGHVPDPLDRLQRRLRAVDRRHLQARQLPRLPLLHPARDLGPGHLRQPGDDRRRQRSSARRRSQRAATTPPIPGDPSAVLRRDRLHRRDRINGPLHTNDALGLPGRPIFGRTRRRDRGQLPAARLVHRAVAACGLLRQPPTSSARSSPTRPC